MLNLEYRIPNRFQKLEEGRVSVRTKPHHSLFHATGGQAVNRYSIFSPLVITQCAPMAIGAFFGWSFYSGWQKPPLSKNQVDKSKANPNGHSH